MSRRLFDTIIVVSTDKEWHHRSVKVKVLEADAINLQLFGYIKSVTRWGRALLLRNSRSFDSWRKDRPSNGQVERLVYWRKCLRETGEEIFVGQICLREIKGVLIFNNHIRNWDHTWRSQQHWISLKKNLSQDLHTGLKLQREPSYSEHEQTKN